MIDKASFTNPRITPTTVEMIKIASSIKSKAVIDNLSIYLKSAMVQTLPGGRLQKEGQFSKTIPRTTEFTAKGKHE
ncbi:hypothetical protein NBRC116583_21670 [Arenicella sp. 4NH20-0111]